MYPFPIVLTIHKWSWIRLSRKPRCIMSNKKQKHCFLVFLLHVFWLKFHDGDIQGSIFNKIFVYKCVLVQTHIIVEVSKVMNLEYCLNFMTAAGGGVVRSQVRLAGHGLKDHLTRLTCSSGSINALSVKH